MQWYMQSIKMLVSYLYEQKNSGQDACFQCGLKQLQLVAEEQVISKNTLNTQS